MKKILNNPTDKELNIQYQGVKYSLGPNESKEYPKEIAYFWKGLHGFLRVEDAQEQVKPVFEKELVINLEEVEKKLDKVLEPQKKSVSKLRKH